MVEIKYVPTICPYCGTGCGLNFVVKDGKIVGVEPLKRHQQSFRLLQRN